MRMRIWMQDELDAGGRASIGVLVDGAENRGVRCSWSGSVGQIWRVQARRIHARLARWVELSDQVTGVQGQGWRPATGVDAAGASKATEIEASTVGRCALDGAL